MSTFVFVHGAWHGGWSWRFVADRLRRKGHAVYTPSLTGLGDRSHLAGPHIGLDTHLQDIESLVRSHDLGAPILVGHSYGGIIIRAVAERIVDRVERLFYIDALVPRDGESAAMLVGEEIAREWASRPRNLDGSIPPSDVSRWGIVDEEQHAWATARVSGHPARTLYEPVKLANPKASVLPSTYVYCSGADGTRQRPTYVTRMASLHNVELVEVRACHDVIITDPERIVSLLQSRALPSRSAECGSWEQTRDP